MEGNKDKTYTFPERESGVYHVRLITKIKNDALKTYVSQESIQKFTVAEFKEFKQHGNAGFDEVFVLHDPTFVKAEKKEPAQEIASDVAPKPPATVPPLKDEPKPKPDKKTPSKVMRRNK